jgi:tetratricopeptide (TPR) repeat protein
MSESKKNFFISYNKADRAWAEWIAWQLEEEGYTTTNQAWDFRPGSNFILEMQQAASETERTIAVLSPDYLSAKFTQSEWAAAFVQDPTSEKAILLPVRVRECEIKGLLTPIVYIDLFKLDEEAAKDALLAGVKRERAKPAKAPGFPGKPSRPGIEKPRFPGALPSIWNIPHGRNPNFTGREELLSSIRDALASGQPAALTQAIRGLGGVGKTQLALEYSYRYGSDYDVVWWIRSEEPTTLASDYASLAAKLDLPEKAATEQRVIVQAVKDRLRQSKNWLLIFDNAPDADSVRDYIPGGNAGHTLVTSRYPNWRGLAQPLSVQVMQPDEAIEFLLKRTDDKDAAAAKLLAEAIGYLPLALEQAGAYIEATGCTLSHYLNLFNEKQKELLQRGKPSNYEDTVATTWNLSFQQVEAKSPAAADLMKLFAFLAPDDIQIKHLIECKEHLPDSLSFVSDPIKLDDAIAILRRYSLIDIEDESISVHRLVQAVTRHKLSEDETKVWVEAAVRTINNVFPWGGNDVRTWPVCSRLLAHAIMASSYGEQYNIAPEETLYLLNKAGMYLGGRAEFVESKSLHERALVIAEATFDSNHPQVALMVNNIGYILRELGDFAEAKAHFERALAIAEAAFGPDAPLVAACTNNVGYVLYPLGDFAGAKAHYERALAISESAFGPNHPQVAVCANNLSSVLKKLGDLAGAKDHLERALIIDEAAYSHNHPKVAIRLNNLGGVLVKLGDLAGAKAYRERALRIFSEFLGENHPDTMVVRENLEWLLKEMEKRK